ncbi:MAG: penicillin-binding protein 2 [Campylobacteraceae bacterium]
MTNTRIKIVISFFIFVWILLLTRVYYISIKSHAYYEEISKSNSVKTELLVPKRGFIYDRNKKPLAVNELGFAIGIKSQLSGKKNEHILDAELDFLVSQIPSLDKESLKRKYLRSDSPYEHEKIQVVDFMHYDNVINSFTQLNLRENISIYPITKRNYPYGSLASHVIGYVGKSNEEDNSKDAVAKLVGYTGKTGVEKYYDELLKGKIGSREVRVTALNEEIEEISRIASSSQNLYLSLDMELQEYIAKLFDGKSGSIIVMDISDGSILSALSFPEYDLNTFVTGISHDEWKAMSEDFNHPFTNKLVNGLYPPGSVVKMSMAMAFLDAKTITANTIIYCPPYIELGGRIFRDWKVDGHGDTDLKKSIRVSSDVYYYKLALESGIDAITPVIERLGFGVVTGIDLPNEFVGIAPGRDWKREKYNQPWYQGETVNTVIGQGYFLATTMQVARNIGMIASGKNIIPHFIKQVDDIEVAYGAEDNIFTDIEKKNLPVIREGMYEVCNSATGTASRHVNSKVKIACKTGTAQVVGIPQEEKVRMKESELEYYQRSHAWLTTYGPYKNPKYVVNILIEHGQSGGRAGGEIVSKIYDKLYEMGYITTLN